VSPPHPRFSLPCLPLVQGPFFFSVLLPVWVPQLEWVSLVMADGWSCLVEQEALHKAIGNFGGREGVVAL
jgi:hypothetical protein